MQAGLLILGDLSIQGNIKAVRSLAEPLQIGMDNGARRALIPIENKRHFPEVSTDIIERIDPIFYSDPLTAPTSFSQKYLKVTHQSIQSQNSRFQPDNC